MPLPSDFWTTSWEAYKHPHTFPNARLSGVASDGNWIWNSVDTNPTSLVEIIQGPLNQNSDPTQAPSENIGYLLGKKTTDPSITVRINVTKPSGFGHVNDPALIDVKLPSYGVSERQYPIYKSPYYRISGPTLDFWVRADGGSGLFVYYLYHVQPVAFRGVISEVVGAILMYAGVDPNQVNQQSFDDAFDEDIAVGPDNANRPYVWIIPQQGETIMDTIKRVCSHWSHVFGWGLDGKIGLWPANSPATTPVVVDLNKNFKGLDVHTDIELLANRCYAMHGAFCKEWEEDSWSSPQPFFNAQWEPKLKSDYLGELIDLYEDTGSQNKFGVREWGGKVRGTGVSTTIRQLVAIMSFSPPRPVYRDLDVTTEGPEISVIHFPLFSLKSIKDLPMEIFKTNEAVPRVVGVLTQDLLGLDLDLGTVVTTPETGGRRFRVIGQTVDWDQLTVESMVVELFPTAFPSAPVVIHSYISQDLAPVGGTSLTRIGNSMELEVALTTESGLDWWYQIFVSKDGEPWEELTSGWTAETSTLIETWTWVGNTNAVEVLIMGADDNGSGDQSIPTSLVAMPTAVQ